MVDPDILILAMINASEGVRALIGDKGAKAVLRDAGRLAGQKLLERLIGHFPEVLSKEEALNKDVHNTWRVGICKKYKKRGWEYCHRRGRIHERYN